MNNKRWDAIWVNGSIATMVEGSVSYGLLMNAALAVKNGFIAWVGAVKDLPGKPEQLATTIYDLEGRCITPGLIDCHTHLVYAGERSQEFMMRLQGKSYVDIAQMGGGIHSTVAATRLATEAELFQQSIPRARALSSEGVTAVEIKSGYGLDLLNELKILRVAKEIGDRLKLTVKKTFLGAHTVPKEYQGQADNYVDLICDEMIPLVAFEQLADFVDVFCETISFNLAQTERIFIAAKKYHLKIKCHAEQLSCSGSAALAAKYRAVSVDHLEYLSYEGVQALAKAGTVAVLLPGAFYFMREKQLPPVERLRSFNVPIAIATDCNPGTSPTTSLLLTMNMALVLFGLTPEEAWLGVTAHAAKALGLEHSHGTLELGKVADFVIWDVEHPVELIYFLGLNRLYKKIVGGDCIDNHF
jgi:imidazolonepropionase